MTLYKIIGTNRVFTLNLPDILKLKNCQLNDCRYETDPPFLWHGRPWLNFPLSPKNKKILSENNIHFKTESSF